MSGRKIIDGLKDAVAGNFASVTIEGQTWVRRDWQPIETAPKDGTPIIGAFWSIRWADSHRKGDIVRCWWQPEFDAFISSCREMSLAEGFTFEDGTARRLHSEVIEPVTHWIPLPSPNQSK